MLHVYKELIPLKTPKIRATSSRIWYMCSGADTPTDEKQDSIEANMVHVYKELIAPLIAIKTPKIRATSSRIWYMCSGADTPKDAPYTHVPYLPQCYPVFRLKGYRLLNTCTIYDSMLPLFLASLWLSAGLSAPYTHVPYLPQCYPVFRL